MELIGDQLGSLWLKAPFCLRSEEMDALRLEGRPLRLLPAVTVVILVPRPAFVIAKVGPCSIHQLPHDRFEHHNLIIELGSLLGDTRRTTDLVRGCVQVEECVDLAEEIAQIRELKSLVISPTEPSREKLRQSVVGMVEAVSCRYWGALPVAGPDDRRPNLAAVLSGVWVPATLLAVAIALVVAARELDWGADTVAQVAGAGIAAVSVIAASIGATPRRFTHTDGSQPPSAPPPR